MRKFLRVLAATAALLGASGGAIAQVITFDALDPSYGDLALSFPLLAHTDAVVEGDFVIGMVSTKADAMPIDLVGAVLNGAEPESCFTVVCPGNNATNYLAVLDDGLPYFLRLDKGLFNMKQFDASFIAATGVDVLPTAMLLRVVGFIGNQFMQEDILLPGPADGAYSFDTYQMSSAFASTSFEEIDFYGYACTTPTTCSRAFNQAQFALDNVTFSAPVPEPETWALLGLGLVAVALARRRAVATAA